MQIAANRIPVPAARRYVWFPSADILDVETASPRSLGLHLVDAHFSVFRFVMRDSEIVAIEFRNQDARLGAKTSGNFGQQSVMVGILLFENIDELIACEVEAPLLRVVTHIVNKTYGRQVRDNLAAVRIEHNQLSRLARDHKKAMIGFVQGHGHILRVARRKRPSSREGRLVPVEHTYRVSTCDVTEHARSAFFKHDRLDMVRVDLDIAQLLRAVRIHVTTYK